MLPPSVVALSMWCAGTPLGVAQKKARRGLQLLPGSALVLLSTVAPVQQNMLKNIHFCLPGPIFLEDAGVDDAWSVGTCDQLEVCCAWGGKLLWWGGETTRNGELACKAAKALWRNQNRDQEGAGRWVLQQKQRAQVAPECRPKGWCASGGAAA